MYVCDSPPQVLHPSAFLHNKSSLQEQLAPRAKMRKSALKCPIYKFYFEICKDTKTKRDLYLTKCLIGDFKKILQKQISEKIQILLRKIYELVIYLKIPDMGKISMHILKFEEFCFTHDFTAL